MNSILRIELIKRNQSIILDFCMPCRIHLKHLGVNVHTSRCYLIFTIHNFIVKQVLMFDLRRGTNLKI